MAKQPTDKMVRGSVNVFRAFNLPNARLEELRSIPTARSFEVLDDKCVTGRKAHHLTGIGSGGLR
jgi:hypothetical protein